MKKDYYYIMIECKDYCGVSLVRGFVDDNKMYGYRYIREPEKSRWECTDLKSGLPVIAKKTIDECVKHTIDYEQDINRKRETKDYEAIVMIFNQLITEGYEATVMIFNQLITEQQMEDEAEFEKRD